MENPINPINLFNPGSDKIPVQATLPTINLKIL
jgi:hypothetical protein